MPVDGHVIGAAVHRLEDDALVRGAGRFVDDLRLPELAAAAFVRSPYSHARINSIDVGAALALPGVIAVFTYDDLAPCLERDRVETDMPKQSLLLDVAPPVLAKREVAYVGESIAVVVAESRYVAEDAADLVELDYDLLPAVADCRDALANDSVLAHTDLPHNLVARFEFDYGGVDEAFEKADRVLGDSFWLRRGGAHSIEGRGVVAQYDTIDDRLTVWSSTQRPHAVKRMLCDLLKRDEDRVRVVAPDLGGAFGPKLVCYPEEIVIALSSMLVGRPVKWIEDRREHFLACTQERDQYWDVQIALDAEARILGIRGALLHDQGAYTARGVNVAYASAVTLPLPYNVPSYHLDVAVVLTNRVPVTPVRGAGQPQGAFVMERLLDRAAAAMSLDRAEVRRRNLVSGGQMPCRKPLKLRGGTELVLDSGDYPATQELALARAGWHAFRQRQEQARADGRYLGIGLANYVEGTGRGPYESVTVRISTMGTILVSSGATAMGQGTRTMLAQVVADQLGRDLSLISVTTGDTAASRLGFGGFNSRQAVTAGASAHAAAMAVRRKVLELAGHLLEAAQDDLEIEGAYVTVRGVEGAKLSLAELARASQGLPGFQLPLDSVGPGLEATECVIMDDMVFSNGSAVAEVEVDPETGAVAVLRFVLAHDCGKMINPVMVDGQLAGAIAHGVGNALFEWMGFDENAQPVTTTLADYLLVSAAEMPAIEVFHRESSSPRNALGVKGVGESGVIPTIAVIASAVEDALTPFGVTVTQAPLIPTVIWDLIQSDSKEGGAGRAGAHWRCADIV